MSGKEEKKDKKDAIYEINLEKKPLETLKDNIKKENISDIKIKNQSQNNNTNSYSKSFESDKNDNKENELINNIGTRNNKNSRFRKRKEEINMLINNNKNKFFNKKRKSGIIQKANKMPELEPHSKYNFSNALKKIKNKSIEKKAKDLFKNNKSENNEKEKNKFINKLKEIEVKIEEISKNKREEENKVEYKFSKDILDDKDINDNEKDNFINFDFNIKLSKGNSENKYQELKKLYFSKNKFDFTSLKKKQTKNIRNSNNNKNNNTASYKKKEDFRGKYINYNIQKLNKKHQKMIRIINNSENFENILDKIGKFEESKNENIFKNNILLNNNNIFDSYHNKNNRIKNNNFDLFKSMSLEKPSKFRNMMEDVYGEIKDMNNYTMKRNFSHKISNIKTNIKFSNYNNNYIMNGFRYNKSSELNFDDLLKLCSKRNITSFVKNSKFSF